MVEVGGSNPPGPTKCPAKAGSLLVAVVSRDRRRGLTKREFTIV